MGNLCPGQSLYISKIKAILFQYKTSICQNMCSTRVFVKLFLLFVLLLGLIFSSLGVWWFTAKSSITELGTKFVSLELFKYKFYKTLINLLHFQFKLYHSICWKKSKRSSIHQIARI
jgi:hypothetical protein